MLNIENRLLDEVFFICYNYYVMYMNKKLLIVIGSIIIVSIIIYYFVRDNYYYYSNKDYLSNISYDISDEFEANIYDSSRYYHYYDDNISCNFNVNYFNNYGFIDGSEYIKDRIMFTLNDEVSDIEVVDINNYKWYYLKVLGSNDVRYYYVTIYNDVGYELEYNISDYLRGDGNSSNGLCYREYDRIISSVKFK